MIRVSWYTFQYLWDVFCGVSQSQHQVPLETSGVQQYAIGHFSNSHSSTALSRAEHCAVSSKSARMDKSFRGLRTLYKTSMLSSVCLTKGTSGFWRLWKWSFEDVNASKKIFSETWVVSTAKFGSKYILKSNQLYTLNLEVWETSHHIPSIPSQVTQIDVLSFL